ncbi:TetR/AcrR family transcriptional regulator, partial [Nocardia abscessus]|uniref:LmrA/YxaF family transcription factor n=1 Tax=Nocardia abscessus TaxID=120957 RepID=UPI002454A99F
PHANPHTPPAALPTPGPANTPWPPRPLHPHHDLRAAAPAGCAAAAEQIEQTGWINMCPVGTVAGEVADSEPTLREVAAEVMAAWIDEGTGYFVRRGLPAPEARELILAVLSALEGAFVLSRTLRSTEPLHAAGRSLRARIEEVLAGVRG